MSNQVEKLYQDVCQYARSTAVLTSIDALLGWDERTQLPPAGAEHRAEQSTLLAGLIHQRWVDPKFGQQLEELARGPLAAEPDSDAGVVVRRLKRQYDKKVKLPQRLVEELARTAILGQQAWQEARQNDDFPAFRPLLEKMIDLKRQQAEALGYPQCPYDALLDEYEPDELTANVGPVLAGLRRSWCPWWPKSSRAAAGRTRRCWSGRSRSRCKIGSGARRPRRSASISAGGGST